MLSQGSSESHLPNPAGAGKAIFVRNDKPALLLACRMNATLGPLLALIRREYGQNRCYEIIENVFPANTPDAEISSMRNIGFAGINDTIVFCDTKVAKCWGLNEGRVPNCRAIVGPALDELVEDVTVQTWHRLNLNGRTAPGDKASSPAANNNGNGIDWSERMAEYGTCFSELLKTALAIREPERIFAAAQELGAHPRFTHYYYLPLKKLLEDFGSDDLVNPQTLDICSPSCIYRQASIPQKILDRIKDNLGLELKQPADFLREWIAAAGFPLQRVQIISDLRGELRQASSTAAASNWLIVDKHVPITPAFRDALAIVEKDQPAGRGNILFSLSTGSRVLRLPLDIFLRDLLGHQLVQAEQCVEPRQLTQAVFQAFEQRCDEIEAQLAQPDLGALSMPPPPSKS